MSGIGREKFQHTETYIIQMQNLLHHPEIHNLTTGMTAYINLQHKCIDVYVYVSHLWGIHRTPFTSILQTG
jgi:hypothetical protein